MPIHSMNRLLALFVVIAVQYAAVCFTVTAAPAAKTIESLEGPVTTNELAAFGRMALAEPLPTHNNHNNLVYGRSHQADDLLVAMYELTGDRVYLNRLIEFSDAILACRNDTNTGDLYWTGKREPTWPSAEEA